MTCVFLLPAVAVILIITGASASVWASHHPGVAIDPGDESSLRYINYQKAVVMQYPEDRLIRDQLNGKDWQVTESTDSPNPGIRDMTNQMSLNVLGSENQTTMSDLNVPRDINLKPFGDHAPDANATAAVATSTVSDSKWEPSAALETEYVFLVIAIFVVSLFPFASLPGLFLLASTSVGDRFDLHAIAFLSAATMTATRHVFFLVSYVGGNAITQKTKNRMRPFETLVKRHGLSVAFLAAAMPVLDDLVCVLLGLIKYSPLRFFVATLAGKLVLSYAIVFASHYLGQSLFDPIMETVDPFAPIHVGIIPFAASVTIMAVLLFRLDWGRILGRFAPWTLDENNPDDGKA